jgi:NAD(P)-dependent dehydrogenase (short-subunit alcohol dehydrogenase family)
MNLGLAGKGCVVTGASSGIGRATAQMLSEEGASVLLVGRREEALREVGPHWLAFDITEPDAGERIVAECEQRFGSLDVLVNNAGTSAIKTLEELSEEDWDEQWKLNVLGPMRLMRAAAPRMAERGWGRIVNVSSSSAKRPSGTNLAYSVAKAAELSLSRGFADQYASKGVRVNAVTPGGVESELWMAEGGMADQLAKLRGTTREEALEERRNAVPVREWATPEEIASVIVFLCSENASYVTGAAWSVDGGVVQVII